MHHLYAILQSFFTTLLDVQVLHYKLIPPPLSYTIGIIFKIKTVTCREYSRFFVSINIGQTAVTQFLEKSRFFQ